MALNNMFQRPTEFNQRSVDNPATPAERAKEIWDAREGRLVTQAYNWRRATVLLGIVCVVLAVGLVWQSLKTQVIPYIVTVDKTTGEVQHAGAFTSNEYVPQEAEVKFFLTDFVKNARTIQLDPIVQQRTQAKAVAFLTKNSARKYLDVLNNENYKERRGSVTVTVHINTIQKVPESEASYQIRWTEEEYGIQSGAKKTNYMSGIFSYTMLPLENDEQLLTNPLGLFITGFDFSNDATQVNRK